MDLNNYGVSELTQYENETISGGGWLSNLFGFFVGTVECAAGAYAQTIQEGGTVATDMPFK
jgi:hypothetical protein